MNFKDIIEGIVNFGQSHASYWGCAIAGEVGEACNLIKKFERDNLDIKELLAEELADIFIYSELIARYFKIDFENAILNKIYKVNKEQLEDSRE